MKPAEKHKSKHVPQSWPTKQSDFRDSPEFYWNYIQKKNQSTAPYKSSRCPAAEQVASYYSSTNSYKLHKNHPCSSSTYSRYTSPHNIESTLQGPPTQLRPNKETRYSHNAAGIRKNCYEENPENNDKRRYITEELGNLTEDNLEDDGGEEVDDDQEEAGEFLDKDYEEQEADDEIDDESDTYPQFHRPQREVKKEGSFRCQQPWKSQEQQQESRRARYHQYIPPPHENLPSARYYHNTTEYDMPEHVLEEDYARNSISLRSPPRRPPVDYHHWSQSRSSANRYDATPLQCHATRRSRTKPEINSPADAEFGMAKRCSRCGSFENRNAPSSGRNNCRFDDRLNFPTKGPIGDDAEVRQQTFCGQCNFRHDGENVRVGCDFPTSNAYPTCKARRSRDVKSPIYESAQQSHVLEKMTKDFPRVPTRYSKDVTSMVPEKSKRSVHTTHGTVRTSSQYAE